jgi:hypothetical protein
VQAFWQKNAIKQIGLKITIYLKNSAISRFLVSRFQGVSAKIPIINNVR